MNNRDNVENKAQEMGSDIKSKLIEEIKKARRSLDSNTMLKLYTQYSEQGLNHTFNICNCPQCSMDFLGYIANHNAFITTLALMASKEKLPLNRQITDRGSLILVLIDECLWESVAKQLSMSPGTYYINLNEDDDNGSMCMIDILKKEKQHELIAKIKENNKLYDSIHKPKLSDEELEKKAAEKLATIEKQKIETAKREERLKKEEEERKAIEAQKDVMIQFQMIVKSFGITATYNNKDGNEYCEFKGDPQKLTQLQEIIKKAKTNQTTFKFGNINKDKSFAIYNKKLKADISRIVSPVKSSIAKILQDEQLAAEKKAKEEAEAKAKAEAKAEATANSTPQERNQLESVNTKTLPTPTKTIPLDEDGWRNVIHSGFCYAKQIDVKWVADEKHFMIDLSNLPSNLDLALANGKSGTYAISDEILNNQMLSRLEKHLFQYASVTRVGNIIYIKPDEKYPQISHIKRDLYVNISETIASLEIVSEPKKKTIITPSVTKTDPTNKSEEVKKPIVTTVQFTKDILDLIQQVTNKSLLSNNLLLTLKDKKRLIEILINKTCSNHLGEFSDNAEKFFVAFALAVNKVKPGSIKFFSQEGNFKLVCDISDATTLRLTDKEIAIAKTCFAENAPKKANTDKNLGNASYENKKEIIEEESKIEDKVKPKMAEPDIVNAMINTVKDVTKSPQRRENLYTHLNTLNAIKPTGTDKDDVNRLIYLLHAFRTMLLLSKKDKYQDLNYKARNALRHKFQSQSLSELYTAFNQAVGELLSYTDKIKKHGADIQFYKIKGDVKEHVTEKIFKCFADVIKNSGVEDRETTEDSPAQIQSWKTAINTIEQSTDFTATEKRDAIIMLHILIGKNKSEKSSRSGEIYRQTGHEGLDKPFDQFADEMYAFSKTGILMQEIRPNNF